MEENKPLEAKLGTNKYFIENSELPIYLVYLGVGKDALFQIQRGEEKSYGFESKGISSWMTFEQLNGFSKNLSDLLDSLEPLDEFDNEKLPNKIEIRVGKDSFYIKADNVLEYALIRDYIIKAFLPICDQWVIAKNIQFLQAERKRVFEENKLKERQTFLDSEAVGDSKEDKE